jgi:hypothetical protein
MIMREIRAHVKSYHEGVGVDCELLKVGKDGGEIDERHTAKDDEIEWNEIKVVGVEDKLWYIC